MQSDGTWESVPLEKWKYLCLRYVGRCRLLEVMKARNSPDILIENQSRLIQQAYAEMEEQCMSDTVFLEGWGTLINRL